MAIAVTVAVYEWGGVQQRSAPNVRNMGIAKLTDTGEVSGAVISPDGRYVAYTLQGARPSVWVRQVATQSAVQVLAPYEGSYMGIAFSPDGDYIYFTRERKEDRNFNDLYEVPVLGGSSKLVVKNLEGELGFSPDQKRIAFIRHDKARSTLNIANSDGTGDPRDH